MTSDTTTVLRSRDHDKAWQNVCNTAYPPQSRPFSTFNDIQWFSFPSRWPTTYCFHVFSGTLYHEENLSSHIISSFKTIILLITNYLFRRLSCVYDKSAVEARGVFRRNMSVRGRCRRTSVSLACICAFQVMDLQTVISVHRIKIHRLLIAQRPPHKWRQWTYAVRSSCISGHLRGPLVLCFAPSSSTLHSITTSCHLFLLSVNKVYIWIVIIIPVFLYFLYVTTNCVHFPRTVFSCISNFGLYVCALKYCSRLTFLTYIPFLRTDVIPLQTSVFFSSHTAYVICSLFHIYYHLRKYLICINLRA